MFHAVNQAPGEEDDDMLPPELPMFRDSSKNASPVAGTRRMVQSTSRNTTSAISGSIHPIAGDASSTTVTAVPSTRPAGTERGLTPRRVLRSRKGGRMEVEMRAVGGSRKLQPTFSRPDGLDDGFSEAGTFRWDATVADAASAQQEGSEDRDIEDASQGGKGIMGMWCKQRLPLPAEDEDMGRHRKPWFVILPESKVHHLFDHLGEIFTLDAPVCAHKLSDYSFNWRHHPWTSTFHHDRWSSIDEFEFSRNLNRYQKPSLDGHNAKTSWEARETDCLE